MAFVFNWFPIGFHNSHLHHWRVTTSPFLAMTLFLESVVIPTTNRPNQSHFFGVSRLICHKIDFWDNPFKRFLAFN